MRRESPFSRWAALRRSFAERVRHFCRLWGFPLACPPDSRLRRTYDGLEIGSLPAGPSYIADHLKTMDMCENPEWQYLHGASRVASAPF